MIKAPAWLPDWRDPSQYHDHGDDATMWAWEFMRRNPDYHADWDSLGIGHTESPAADDTAFHIDARLVPLGEPSALVLEARRLGEKWGLFHGPIEDPAHRRPVGSHGPVFSGPGILGREDLGTVEQWGGWREVLTPERVAVVFDMRQSVPHQWTAAKVHLQARQRELIERGAIVAKTGRAQDRKLYRRYLRLLDADAAGAKPRAIAKALMREPSPPGKAAPWPWRDPKGQNDSEALREAAATVSHALAAAKKMVARGYLDILPRAPARM